MNKITKAKLMIPNKTKLTRDKDPPEIPAITDLLKDSATPEPRPDEPALTTPTLTRAAVITRNKKAIMCKIKNTMIGL